MAGGAFTITKPAQNSALWDKNDSDNQQHQQYEYLTCSVTIRNNQGQLTRIISADKRFMQQEKTQQQQQWR